jgi:NTP pyrophosphatase (non-canonical NTP hydrolase)
MNLDIMLHPTAQATRLLVTHCHGASVEAGWWTDLKTGEPLEVSTRVPEKLMLCVSELAEAMEGHRKNKMDDKLPHRPMIEVELADAVIRIADLAGALGLDLGGAVAEKMEFNKVRPDHKIENRLAVGGKAY